jgi:hypothetical protein
MKKATKFLIATALFFNFFATSNLQAQDYSSAVGLRLGGYNGITFKHFFNEKSAIELYGTARSYFGYSFYNVTALYEMHNAIDKVDGLKYYYGGGVTAGLSSYNSFYFASSSSTSIGIAGILGLEYCFKNPTINISLDWVPTYYVSDSALGFASGYGALSARYYFGGK